MPKIVLGSEVLDSEEFQALNDKFGLWCDSMTQCVTLIIPRDGVVQISQDYPARVAEDEYWEGKSGDSQEAGASPSPSRKKKSESSSEPDATTQAGM